MDKDARNRKHGIKGGGVEKRVRGGERERKKKKKRRRRSKRGLKSPRDLEKKDVYWNLKIRAKTYISPGIDNK